MPHSLARRIILARKCSLISKIEVIHSNFKYYKRHEKCYIKLSDLVNTENKSGNIYKMEYKLRNKQNIIVSDKIVNKIDSKQDKINKMNSKQDKVNKIK